MIIVYYRDADGKIVRAHTAPEDWTMETADASDIERGKDDERLDKPGSHAGTSS